MYRKVLKRLIDFFVSSASLFILSPFFLFLWVLVRIKLGNPVLFIHKRPGLHGNLFNLFKFRTMTNTKDSDGNLLPDKERMTSLGRFLRRNSVDELPQLINVLKGDMSLVGPRPLELDYLPYYSEKEKTRHNVRPGMTGLAQVNGRNNIDWDTKLALDVCYVENLNFSLDIQIIFKTMINIIKRQDISKSGLDSPGRFDVYRKKQLQKNKQVIV
ncbi:MAG: sugar transferase [Candidatus Delongbacteria bacterium]|nr:sugar transferase [Candidatus Delongbacteria bacterium]